MSLRNDAFTLNRIKEEAPAFNLARVPHYVICACLGGLSGIMGVALVLGLVVVGQLFLFQHALVMPNTVALTLVAVVTSCGTAWLVAQVGKWMVSSLVRNFTEQSWQVLFFFAILATLLEYPLFFYGM